MNTPFLDCRKRQIDCSLKGIGFCLFFLIFAGEIIANNRLPEFVTVSAFLLGIAATWWFNGPGLARLSIWQERLK